MVDGRAAPIYPAAGVFFAVPVPAGRHRVALSFRAPGFAAGLALGGSWLLLAGLAFAPDVRARARAAR